MRGTLEMRTICNKDEKNEYNAFKWRHPHQYRETRQGIPYSVPWKLEEYPTTSDKSSMVKFEKVRFKRKPDSTDNTENQYCRRSVELKKDKSMSADVPFIFTEHKNVMAGIAGGIFRKESRCNESKELCSPVDSRVEICMPENISSNSSSNDPTSKETGDRTHNSNEESFHVETVDSEGSSSTYDDDILFQWHVNRHLAFDAEYDKLSN